MPEVTKKDIKKVARLARISVSETESETFATQVGSIINWVEQLNEVDTKNVAALTNVHDMPLRMSKDEVSDGDIAEDVLKNAKDAKYGYFAVPKVIE
jgi:aspartyl-tRNA(Asn)/glutamyl-tRNA(Gln) amidotransferase subunit C